MYQTVAIYRCEIGHSLSRPIAATAPPEIPCAVCVKANGTRARTGKEPWAHKPIMKYEGPRRVKTSARALNG